MESYQYSWWQKKTIRWCLFWTLLAGIISSFFLFFPYSKRIKTSGVVVREEKYYVKVCFEIHSLDWYNSLNVMINQEKRSSRLVSLESHYTMSNGGQQYQCGYLKIPLTQEEEIENKILVLEFENGKTTWLQEILKKQKEVI